MMMMMLQFLFSLFLYNKSLNKFPHSFIRVKYHTSCHKSENLVKLEKIKILGIKENEKETNLIKSLLYIFFKKEKYKYLRQTKPGKSF